MEQEPNTPERDRKKCNIFVDNSFKWKKHLSVLFRPVFWMETMKGITERQKKKKKMSKKQENCYATVSVYCCKIDVGNGIFFERFN